MLSSSARRFAAAVAAAPATARFATRSVASLAPLRTAVFASAGRTAAARALVATPARCTTQTRHNSSNTASFKADNPQMMIAFTCKKCDTRSSHTFSKQGYVKGTVLIQCPGCKGRHLIADNLKIFDDNKVNLEDILRAKGESVATGTDDLVFEDIPESLKGTLGHYAKDAPEEYRKPESDADEPNALPEK